MYDENQIIKIKWIPRTKKYYESLGYKYTGRNTELSVKLSDLLPDSNERINVNCDMCGEPTVVPWRNYNRITKRDGKYLCKECVFKTAMQRRDERKRIQEYQLFLDKCKKTIAFQLLRLKNFMEQRLKCIISVHITNYSIQK